MNAKNSCFPIYSKAFATFSDVFDEVSNAISILYDSINFLISSLLVSLWGYKSRWVPMRTVMILVGA